MTKNKSNPLRVSTIIVILIVTLIVLSILALRIGSVEYSTREILLAFSDKDSEIRTIILNLRFPRVVISIIIGMCLATSGALLQAVMRNPLADPGIIGISSGASVIATAILLMFPALSSSLPIFAFVGAGIACLLIYALAWNKGIDPVRIILSAVGAFLAAATVAIVGIIGFVGLIVPHIARMFVGYDYKIMMPTGMLLGSCIVLFADTVGRSAFGSFEVPLGIIMAVIGGPFFLYLLRRGGKTHAS